MYLGIETRSEICSTATLCQLEKSWKKESNQTFCKIPNIHYYIIIVCQNQQTQFKEKEKLLKCNININMNINI